MAELISYAFKNYWDIQILIRPDAYAHISNKEPSKIKIIWILGAYLKEVKDENKQGLYQK